MLFAKTIAAVAAAALACAPAVAGLGINCRGSGLCPLASFENQGNVDVLQGLRDAVYSTNASDSTHYADGDHVICISESLKITISPSISAGYKGATAGVTVGLSGKLGSGGVCVFPQNTGSAGVTLGQVKTLMDGLLNHGCNTCGSNPTQPGNNVKSGELTVNYVHAPSCTGNCLSTGGGPNPTAPRGLATRARTHARDLPPREPEVRSLPDSWVA